MAKYRLIRYVFYLYLVGIEQIPTITISNVKASIDEEQPYIILNPKDNTDLIIIETTDSITSLSDSTVMGLLTETEFIVQGAPDRPAKINLSDFDDLVITQEKLNYWMEYSKWYALGAFPFALLFWFAYRIIQALIYALIGMIFAQILNVRMEYQTLLRLAVIAVTPAVIINMIINVLDFYIPLWSLICLATAMVYLFFAVKVNSMPPPDQFEGQDQPTFHLPSDYQKQ